MPGDNSTTTKFKVDISDLKKGIQDANRQIKLANAEFKAASAGMDDWGKSADGVRAKITQTEKVLKAQKTILAQYEKQLALVVAEYGESSKEADELRIKLENQRATVIKTEKSLGEYKAQLSELEAEQKKSADAAEKQASAYDTLKSKIGEQEKQLEALKTEYANVVLEQGKESDAAKELGGKIDELSGDLKENKDKLKEVEDAADDLDQSLMDADDGAKEAGEGFTVFKGILVDLVATGIKSAINGIKNLAGEAKKSFQEFDDGRDKIVAMTGATGEAADDLMKAYKGVASSVQGDFGEMGEAVGELSTRFGVSGDELEKLATQFVKFSKLNNANVSGSVDDVQKALSAFGMKADKAGDFLDALNKVAQDTGVDVSTLAKGLIQNGTAFKEMGLSIQQSAALMGQMEKSGANTETVMNGLRKALKSATKDGIPLSQALSELEKEIIGNDDSTKGLQAAYNAFGKSGDQIYGALKNGTLSFQSVSLAADEYKDSIEKTYEGTLDASDKVKLAFQRMKLSAADVVDRILTKYGPDIEKAIEKITPVIEDVVEWLAVHLPPAIEVIRSAFVGVAEIFKSVFGWLLDHSDAVITALVAIGAALVAWKLTTIVTGVISLVKAIKMMGAAASVAAVKQGLLNSALLANPIALVVAAIAALIAIFVSLWNKSEAFREFWQNLWERIKLTVQTVWKVIKDAASAAWDLIKKIWNGVPAFFGRIWDDIKAIFSAVGAVLSGDFSGAWELIKGVWNNVVQFFADVWDGIKDIFSGIDDYFGNMFSNAWKKLVDIFSPVSEWVQKNIIEPVAGLFTDFWDNWKTGVKAAWDAVTGVFGGIADWFKDKFSKAWQAVKDVFSTGGKVFEGIKDGIVTAFKAVVNFIIRGINKVVSLPFDAINGILQKLRDLEILGLHPFDWLTARLPVPQIPELARGGVLKRGQVGLLEGDGAEAVVPLENNQKWIAATAAALKKQLAAEGVVRGSAGSAGVTNNYNFVQTNNSPKALSRLEIYRQSKNLLRMKGAT